VDFDFTEDQRTFRDTVVDFARRHLNEALAERDAASEFSYEGWKKCAEFGILGLPVPVEHGGQGADPLTVILGMEALGYGCRDNGLLFSLNAQMWSCEIPIVRFGNDEQRRRYLPGLCDGSIIGIQGMSEPDSGSDAFNLATMARRDGDYFILDGTKTFITNAPVADVFVVFASTDRAKGAFGLSAFLVDRKTSGVEIGPPFHKMGLRTSPMSQISFTECRIPATNLLGPFGAGMAIFNHSMEWERGIILASAIGTMQRQLESAVAYARLRQQFGKPIGKFQAVSHRLADMKVRLEAGRLLLYHLGWTMAQGRTSAVESAMVKLFVSESFVQSSLDTVRTYGGTGYMTDAEIERDLRDAIGSEIYSGTSDIQRNLIARHLGL
jgi:alkylation response protein AidB-like acyl-CoA dehydrogenase